MQESISIPHWLSQGLQTVVTLIAGGGILKAYNVWLNRKKPAADIQETTARATEITIRSQSSASDAVLRMMDRLEKAIETRDRIQRERDELKTRVELQRIELQSADDQMKRMKAYMEIKGLKYYEMDQLK